MLLYHQDFWNCSTISFWIPFLVVELIFEVKLAHTSVSVHEEWFCCLMVELQPCKFF